MNQLATIRAYKEVDKPYIINLFTLNTPRYFSPDEEKDLIDYLDHEIELYYVMEVNNLIVGSGGINFNDDKKTGIISWDFIHPNHQGMGLGKQLLTYRIDQLKLLKETEKKKGTNLSGCLSILRKVQF